MNKNNPKTRIAKNTLFLYGQLLASMAIGLYTSRVVLKVLGVDDFGIFNVVGGVVGMFGILNAAMASSSSRFITFELGKGSTIEKLKTVFGTSLYLHLGLAVIICLITSLVGGWFLTTQMQIPSERMSAALWVFYGTIGAIFFSIISVPFTATIIAHERMNIFAYFTILDLVLKLGIVFLLQVVDFDKLKIYAVLTVLVQVIMRIVNWIYCYQNFSEVRGRMTWSKSLFKKMTSFAGWSLFGDSAVLMFTEGINILLNIFFGASVNAARGIAVQMQAVVYRFIVGFQTAINPQITKSYAANELTNMHKLIYASSKFSFFMFLLLALPVLFETEDILIWWLNILPDHTVNFVRLMLLISLIDCLANPLVFSAKATGRIRSYQAILGSFLLLIVPISYVFLKMGYSPESVFIVHLIIAILGQIIRVVLIVPMINLSLRDYMSKVIIKCILVFVLGLIAPSMIYFTFQPSFLRFIFVFLSILGSVPLLVYFLAMDNNEKQFLKQNLLARIFKKEQLN